MKTVDEQETESEAETFNKIVFWFVAVVTHGAVAFLHTGPNIPNLIGATVGAVLANLAFGGLPYVLSVQRKNRAFPKFAKYMFFGFLIQYGLSYLGGLK